MNQTEDDRAADVRLFERLQASDQVVEAVHRRHPHGRGNSGVMRCPLCKRGLVRYRLSCYGEKVFAACSTKNCLKIEGVR